MRLWKLGNNEKFGQLNEWALKWWASILHLECRIPFFSLFYLLRVVAWGFCSTCELMNLDLSDVSIKITLRHRMMASKRNISLMRCLHYFETVKWNWFRWMRRLKWIRSQNRRAPLRNDDPLCTRSELRKKRHRFSLQNLTAHLSRDGKFGYQLLTEISTSTLYTN